MCLGKGWKKMDEENGVGGKSGGEKGGDEKVVGENELVREAGEVLYRSQKSF